MVGYEYVEAIQSANPLAECVLGHNEVGATKENFS
jgi:hypothetical protein